MKVLHLVVMFVVMMLAVLGSAIPQESNQDSRSQASRRYASPSRFENIRGDTNKLYKYFEIANPSIKK
ncbi:unnamed protein product [Darwinula stevensoni]|uniref:Uncharacterized protein n=1 Tax=Darwinula stevensoni TaxID=69355 RepID=A0A7R8ZZM3_9CRUS|nr:unnamed protein product [Darwinula stevensoni]CAG0879107.1 unnamed protein product [Darwinula stevensoni]